MVRNRDPLLNPRPFRAMHQGGPAPWEREALLQQQEHILQQKHANGFPQKRPSPHSRPTPSQPSEHQLATAFRWLEEHFPLYFGTERVIQPLSLSFLHEIKVFYYKGKDTFPPHLPLRAALKRYCAQDEYLATLVPNATRYNLQGKPCGIVTEEEAKMARERLAKSFKERF